MSRKTYSCFVCQKNGYDDIQVFLAGKDEQGKTVYLEPDGVTRHIHKQQEQQQQQPTKQQQQQQQQSGLEKVSDESVDRGITAFSMMSSLIVLVEQTQKQVVSMDEKLDRLTKLVYALSQHKEDNQNPHTLLDNR